MDLTRLYNLTTPELREEAERLGVRDTYAMSRGQLIHAIRSQQSPASSGGLLGKVIGFAKWALQTTAAPSEEEDEPGRPRRSSAPMPIVSSATAAHPSEPAEEPESAPSSSYEETPPPPMPAAPEPDPALASSPERPPAPPLASAPGSSSRPPAGVFSSAGAFEEPFPTRTMARILADQGHFKRSLAIYAKLLVDQPNDTELSGEAERVRAQARARRSEHP